MKKRLRKLLKIVLIVVGSLAAIGFIIFKTPLFLSDIRPDTFQNNYTFSNNGQAYLEKSQLAHGMEHWLTQDSIRYEIKHTLHSGMAQFMLAPDSHNPLKYDYLSFPQDRQSSFYRSNSPESSYLIGCDDQGVFKESEEKREYGQSSLDFFYYAIKHLIEFAFEMNSASIIEYMEEQKVDGKTYELLFATWESMEPIMDYDQYIIWINKQTGLIERFDATGRGIAPFAIAKVTFEYGENNGKIIIPKVVKVISATFGEKPVMTVELISQTPG